MPNQLKRRSLARLLASLCPPPSRASSYPVQTGFPTSLADLVVRNHGRLRKPRKPRGPATLAAMVPYPVVTADELPLPPPEPLAPVASPVEVVELVLPPPPTQPLSPVAVPVRQVDTPTIFRLRPELLALGGAVVLALLAVWSEGTVAAFTLAALSLLWIESTSRRRPPTKEAVVRLDSCGRGPVSPIREAEEAPRSSCSDSDKGSVPASPRTAAGGGDERTPPKRKGNKRSLRKLISKKLHKKPKSKDSPCSLADFPEAAGPVLKTSSLVVASESGTEWSSSSESVMLEVATADRRVPGVKFPMSALVPVILAGLAAGKLPATALSVLCVAFFSGAAQRL